MIDVWLGMIHAMLIVRWMVRDDSCHVNC